MGKKRVVVFFLVMLAFTLTACGKKKEIYDSGKDGFTQITSVDGISFDVVADVARNATAVTNISEEMAFEPDQTYAFKDGEEEYFLFRIDSIVCVAQKGTSFGLYEAENKLEAVRTGNILGIYFTSPAKKLDFVENEKNGEYKLVATVTAQVALTSELYNDFAGRLAYLYDGEEEWTLFVGTIGEDFEDFNADTKEVITYMAASMKLHEMPEREAEPEPAVMLGGDHELSSNMEPQAISDNTVSSNSINESGVPVDEGHPESEEETGDYYVVEAAGSAGQEEEPVAEKTEEVMEEEEPEALGEVTVVAGGALQTDDSEVVDENESDGSVPEIQIPVQALQRGVIRLDNQRNTVRNDDTVYYSDIYDLLDIGKWAYASILLPDASGYQTVEIKIDKVCTGAEAEKVIENASRSGAMAGSLFEPPEGCTFHAIHYTAVFPSGNASGYINVKLRGMDGENLRFRGISYTQRTYDIKVSDTEFYAFYAVPNGCKEYVIEVGEGTGENIQKDVMPAYYRYREG